MCRWAAWQGKPLFLSDILTAPDHSLIAQSRDASKSKTHVNADGFGVAWYDQRPHPGLYRDVHPAWSDPNLHALAEQVRAGLFLGHVRASTGTATSRANCHPFAVENWSFMHNGQIGGFEHFRKQVDMMIPDHLYQYRAGTSDSEALFLIALGLGLKNNPKDAMRAAIQRVESCAREQGQRPFMRVAAALSDGASLYALRYASDAHAPSLFYRWDAQAQGWAVVSEPYDNIYGTWTEVPQGSFCVFTPTDVEVSPFELASRKLPSRALDYLV